MPYDKETKSEYDRLRRESQTPEWHAAESERLRQYRIDNPEARRKAVNKYARSEKGKVKAKAWKDSNPEKWAGYQDKYIETHKAEILVKQRVKNQQKRRELIDILGGPRCVWCGFDWLPCLEIDHIADDGHTDPHRFNKYWYCRRPELARKTLQVLCANCNKAKEVYMLAHPETKGRITYEMLRMNH